MDSAPTGILLVNLGTPESPEVADVRRYLREFLSDPRVIDINPVGRWLLLNLIILPLRPARSAEAYRKVWTDQGSPLLVHGKALTEAIAERLQDHDVVVELAMRYGSPSIEHGLNRLREAGCDRIVAVPLYPQYASSSTGSSVEKLYEVAKRLWNTPYIDVVPAFYDDPRFIEAFAEVGRTEIEALQPDHVLMSFHGLPERHVIKSDETGQHCLKSEHCCEQIGPANRNCYRAQCFATARALASLLDLPSERWSVTFQSRLGRDPWIAPYTDVRIEELAKSGTKKVAVMCPAFVADCLETLEEIGMTGAESFVSAGGEQLRLVPSLNSHPAWVNALASLIAEHLPTRAGGSATRATAEHRSQVV